MGAASHDEIWTRHGSLSGLSRQEYDSYFVGSSCAVAITLRDVAPFAARVPLADLRKGRPWFQPPQSFRYLSAAQVASLNLPGVATPQLSLA
jgi:predicted transcriptional regulator